MSHFGLGISKVFGEPPFSPSWRVPGTSCISFSWHDLCYLCCCTFDRNGLQQPIHSVIILFLRSVIIIVIGCRAYITTHLRKHVLVSFVWKNDRGILNLYILGRGGVTISIQIWYFDLKRLLISFQNDVVVDIEIAVFWYSILVNILTYVFKYLQTYMLYSVLWPARVHSCTCVS